MAGKPHQMGDTGRLVASNIRCARQLRGLSYAEFSRRLTAYGHPILDTGLMKIEKGTRRVDVDDLVALGAILEIAPAFLIMGDVRQSLPF
jgi:hypothetical protein